MKYGNPSKKARTLASTRGHCVLFPGKGTPKEQVPEHLQAVSRDDMWFVHVPDIMKAEVAAAGMLPETEIEEVDEPTGPKKPTDPAELQKVVFETFDLMVAAADRESFSGTGMPKEQALEKLLGYALHKTEIKDLWTKYMAAKKDA